MNRPNIKDFFAEKTNITTVHNEYKNSPHLYSYSSELDRYVDFLEDELAALKQSENVILDGIVKCCNCDSVLDEDEHEMCSPCQYKISM